MSAPESPVAEAIQDSKDEHETSARNLFNMSSFSDDEKV